jgi:signal transduction histidine kinase
MTNTVKHAGARTIRITYREVEGRGELRIADDGAGLPAGAGTGPGFGLRGMRERAERINGELVVSGSPGHGTEILVRLSLEPPSCTHPSSSSS